MRLYLQVRHSQRIGKKVKVCRNAMDHVTGDGALLVREGGDKCVLAEEIDDSRDASGRGVDIPNYLIGKSVESVQPAVASRLEIYAAVSS